MPWYKCLVHGQDFPGRVAGSKGSVDFYATRVVSAVNEDEAEFKVVLLLEVEPVLKVPRIFRHAHAKINFENVELLPDHHRLVRHPPFGFSFFVTDAKRSKHGASSRTV